MYTTIADRLRTVSRSNDSHPTGVDKPYNGVSTFQLPQTLCNQMDKTFKKWKLSSL